MFGTSQFNTPKKPHIVHLANRNQFVFNYFVRVYHGAVSRISYYRFYFREFIEHSELIITRKGNDRRRNTNTMPGREMAMWEEIYNYRQWVERFNQYTKSKDRYRYWTTNERRNNYENRMEYQTIKDTTRFPVGIKARSNASSNTILIPNQNGQN